MDKEALDILKTIQKDIKTMQNDMNVMRNDMNTIQNDINTMQNDIKNIKTTQGEHTQILRALEHKTDVISAEQENLKHEVVEIKGEVKSIGKDLSNVELITASNWSDIAKLKAIK